MNPWTDTTGYKRTLRHGHLHTTGGDIAAGTAGPEAAAGGWTAKPGSHDDGSLSGLFLGGIGAPVVGRNLDGRFARWHLQPGYHVNQGIEEAFFGVRWRPEPSDTPSTPPSDTRGGGYIRLNKTVTEHPGDITRRVYSLFPVIHERYSGKELPIAIILELWTPIVGSDGGTRRIGPDSPVWHATITVENRSEHAMAVDTVCFWPNVLGWRTQQMTTVDRPERSWPGQTHAGNTAQAIRRQHPDGTSVVAALQQRNPGRPVRHDMEGEIAVYSLGPESDRVSVEACLKTEPTKIDRPPVEQGHTVAWAEAQFRRKGALPQTGLTWRAHWHEALASAVHRGFDLPPGSARSVTYTFAFDMPIVTFGEGRRWYRRYTQEWGCSGIHALAIAAAADTEQEKRRADIDRWQTTLLAGPKANGTDPDGTASWQSPTLRAAMINELYFINGGGSVWVDRWAQELDDHLPEPLLGGGTHAAILEGYDDGYYYYNTSDLWPYAWYAVCRWWPEFADAVFSDLLLAIPIDVPEERVIYRTEQTGTILAAGKVPHDLGAVMEDPWHRLNGYQMRDDSNLWKDHNPGFIVSFYLYLQERNRPITTEEWNAIREAGTFLLTQDDDADGLLIHDEFGDSTWDNLGIRGHAAYSGGMTIAALAALSVWARERGDTDFAAECDARRNRGTISFTENLWNGEYFRLCDAGRYADSVMADALIGLYLADLAGLGDMLFTGIPRHLVVRHLEAVVRYNVEQYHNGRVGPLLVAAPGVTAFAGDGGDELQVNEVLIGSAWMTVAMLAHFGLIPEAERVAGALTETLYNPDGNGRGLQFRTPAAIDGAGRFRAPMNMRPLAIWFLDALGYAVDSHATTTPHERTPT
jgi:non-lysosomal glucosylceramidase